ncbi:MAG TPA: hypothetical protein VGY48_25595 [Vicinamibacterales bacterium]|jgi:hypothetical protein|nr:hypothetical protein [Vicinamibacterales bacterium]
MQQRQLRLGDILDDYCPRERRVTNHAVVAMVGDDVKQTRCQTCDAEHEYKHAKVPRQRRKNEAPAALYAQVAANAPKRVTPGSAPNGDSAPLNQGEPLDASPSENAVDAVKPGGPGSAVTTEAPVVRSATGEAATEDREREGQDAEGRDSERQDAEGEDDDDRDLQPQDEGPVHRPLIRASLPRPEGQQPPSRPIPEFTIRQPGGGRPSRFRPRHQRGGPGGAGQGGGYQFHGNRSNGNVGGPMRGPRPNSGRPGMAKRHGPGGAGGGGRKRSK